MITKVKARYLVCITHWNWLERIKWTNSLTRAKRLADKYHAEVYDYSVCIEGYCPSPDFIYDYYD